MSEQYATLIRRVELKNFRCFQKKTVELEAPLVLIEGANGSGKTSFFEALYYACYLRSFRTHIPRELVHFNARDFFIKIEFEEHEQAQAFNHAIHVGFSEGKRLVKLDQSVISSYKELMQHYRIVSLTEDDLQLITGDPSMRRSFLDQIIILENPEFAAALRDLKYIVTNRNALLAQHSHNQDLLTVLTEQLQEKSEIIRAQRITMLTMLIERVHTLMIKDLETAALSIKAQYKPKPSADIGAEVRMGRSLQGAHLDDFILFFDHHNSRHFSSRGQQKLLILLLRIAQMQRLKEERNSAAILLLDDFMTDLDEKRAHVILDRLIDLSSQLIFSSPLTEGFLAQELRQRGALILPFER